MIEGQEMTYAEAYSRLSDVRASLSSTFGNPGEPGYCAFYRTQDGQRYELSNGPWNGPGNRWAIRRA